MTVARVDLHCHTSASFDGHVDPVTLVRRAAERGLTHLAITDHDTIDGALEAAAGAPAGIVVIVGSEVLTTEGDLIFVFLSDALPKGLSAREAIEAGRRRGALVGIPHPYDRTRRSLLLDPANADLVGLVDWIEVHNARVPWRRVNQQAADLARRTGVPGIGVSDAHALLEVGAAWTGMTGDPGDPQGLLAALRGPMTIEGEGGPTRTTSRSWWSRLLAAGRRGAPR